MGKGAKLMIAIFGFVFIITSGTAFLGYKALNTGHYDVHDANPSVCVEPMDPNAGPQGMQSDNPDFGGGPNLRSNTRQSPDPLWFRYYRLLIPSATSPSMILYYNRLLVIAAICAGLGLLTIFIIECNTTTEDPSTCNE